MTFRPATFALVVAALEQEDELTSAEIAKRIGSSRRSVAGVLCGMTDQSQGHSSDIYFKATRQPGSRTNRWSLA